MTIKEIAKKINKEAENYQFGRLQEIRKEIKGLTKKASSTIFTNQSISDDGWAFHFGGRKEIQFNIGFENEGLRYGLAFSLETSRSLSDFSILHPKILKLNSLIKNEPELFEDYKMWYERESRSEISDVFNIDEKLIRNGTFIFIGKILAINKINYDEILSTFDTLLNVYQEIESNPNNPTKILSQETKFEFDNKSKNLPKESNYNILEKEVNLKARHSYLQEKLYSHLVKIHGKEYVGLENQINGKRIDVVVKNKDDKYIFYEVKTGSSAKSCIRQALGQLCEYAYWNNSEIEVEMVIAGEFVLDKMTADYIQYLKSNFNLPVSYHCIET